MKKFLGIFAIVFAMFTALPASAQSASSSDPFGNQPPITQKNIDEFLKIYEDVVVATQNNKNPTGSFKVVGWDMMRGAYIMSKVGVGMTMLGPESDAVKQSKLGAIPKQTIPSDAELDLIKKNKPRFDAIDAKHGWDPFKAP